MSEPSRKHRLAWLTRIVFACVALAGAGWAQSATPDTPSGAPLRARYVALGEELRHNQFQRTLYLESAESSHDLRGDIYALVDYPFAAATPDYLEIQLNAENGPLGTSDYRILLEAVSVEGGRTFLHITYSYAYGLTGRLAMQTYLATVGHDKLGFTIIGKLPNGLPDHIRGVRGVAERNTMRYYMAIDAYLGPLAVPPPEQLEKRLQSWFTSAERYPLQLHEVDRASYLDMKRREYLRQQTVQSGGSRGR